MSRPPPHGACPRGDGVCFRVWAPGKREVPAPRIEFNGPAAVLRRAGGATQGC